jgi:hypothetical protein
MNEAETRAELIDPKLKESAFPIPMSRYGGRNAPFKGVHNLLIVILAGQYTKAL